MLSADLCNHTQVAVQATNLGAALRSTSYTVCNSTCYDGQAVRSVNRGIW